MILELSGKYPVKHLCEEMEVNRSGFYKWLNRTKNPTSKQVRRIELINLFTEYHNLYPSHGYRWLNAKIKLDTGEIISDQLAHRVCKYSGIKSEAKHARHYQKREDGAKTYPNLVLQSLNITAPFQVVVSDMTAFWTKKGYHELTLFMDLFNNEIIAYGLSNKKGDPQTYYKGLEELLKQKEEYKDFDTILHTDQGSVYSSIKFNNSLEFYNIIHSMSRAGTPTDNGAMEAINGWIKEELFIDFKIYNSNDIEQSIKDYINYFNTQRPSIVLNFETPQSYKEKYYKKEKI